MSLVASFCKGVNKHRFGKRYYAMPMVRKKNVRRSGGPSQWLPLRKPAMHHSTPGTTDRKASSILPNPPDATRPNCPTTSAETANHRAHDKWPVGHSDKKRARNCARPHRLIRRRRPIVGHCVLTTAEIGEVLCNPPDRAKPAHRRRIKLNRWPVL